jgi:hypothetical protein
MMKAIARFAVCAWAALALATGLLAAEIKGKVTAIQDGAVLIRTESDLVPNPGDKAEIYFEIPRMEDIAHVASGRVTGVAADVIRIKIDQASAKVTSGQLARVSSDHPRRRGSETQPEQPTPANQSGLRDAPQEEDEPPSPDRARLTVRLPEPQQTPSAPRSDTAYIPPDQDGPTSPDQPRTTGRLPERQQMAPVRRSDTAFIPPETEGPSSPPPPRVGGSPSGSQQPRPPVLPWSGYEPRDKNGTMPSQIDGPLPDLSQPLRARPGEGYVPPDQMPTHQPQGVRAGGLDPDGATGTGEGYVPPDQIPTHQSQRVRAGGLVRQGATGTGEGYVPSDQIPTQQPQRVRAGGLDPDGATGAGEDAPSQTIRVPANRSWTATGIHAKVGTLLTFTASGRIEAAPETQTHPYYHSVPARGRKEPLADAPEPTLPSLALIGRIGPHGRPFLIGSGKAIVSGNGQIFLGINQSVVSENSGEWTVRVTLQPRD